MPRILLEIIKLINRIEGGGSPGTDFSIIVENLCQVRRGAS